MYSGTGKVVFDWIDFAKDELDFEILIDVLNYENAKVVKDFAEDRGIIAHFSPGTTRPGHPDNYSTRIVDLLKTTDFDFVEIHSWANAATNTEVARAVGDTQALYLTPHTQPTWSIPNSKNFFSVAECLVEVLQRADGIFLDSEQEKYNEIFEKTDSNKLHFTSLGVNYPENLEPVEGESDLLICIADGREPRKRLNSLIYAFSKIDPPNTTLIIAGKETERLTIPDSMKGKISLLGFIAEEQKWELYQKARGFVLLSEFEAFGLPIAESLCFGIPCFLNSTQVLEDIYSEFENVSFTNVQNTEKLIMDLNNFIFTSRITNPTVALRAREKFGLNSTYGKKLEIVKKDLERKSNK
jgi:hypothetical protein